MLPVEGIGQKGGEGLGVPETVPSRWGEGNGSKPRKRGLCDGRREGRTRKTGNRDMAFANCRRCRDTSGRLLKCGRPRRMQKSGQRASGDTTRSRCHYFFQPFRRSTRIAGISGVRLGMVWGFGLGGKEQSSTPREKCQRQKQEFSCVDCVYKDEQDNSVVMSLRP
jgi:hypothetical protein